LATSWKHSTQAGLISHAEACQIAGHKPIVADAAHPFAFISPSGAKTAAVDFQTPLAEQMNISASATGAPATSDATLLPQQAAVRQFNTILLQHLQRYLFPEEPPHKRSMSVSWPSNITGSA